jgi:HSP20 family molecular chaperone IbpA
MSKRQVVSGNVVLCDNEQPIVTEVDEVQSRIRQRAFEISLTRSHAKREIDDWLVAESEVIVSPPVEVAEKKGLFIISIAAPGIDAENLTVMATRDQILVKADFRHNHEPEAQIHSCDFRSTMMFRSVRLPEPIDLRSLKTKLTDGVLRITAQREGAVEAPKTRPARKASSAAKPRKSKA